MMPEPSAVVQQKRFGQSSLSRRVITAACLLPLALLALYSTHHWPLYLLVAIASVLACMELKKLMGFAHALPLFLALAAWVTGTLWFASYYSVPLVTLVALVIGVVAILHRIKLGKRSWVDYLSLGWLGGPIASSIWLQHETLDPTKFFSPNLLLLVMVPLWIGDTAAYFVGKKFGRTLLAPKISPKKTWEGAIANFFACIISACVIAMLLSFDPYLGAGVGVILGIFGQIGDLLQSALKRSAGSKDSGNILPGHGGVLDRIDSLLMASVPATLILWMFLQDK